MKKKDPLAIGGVEISGEAIHLLRQAPLHVTAAYFIGTLPFVIGILYFWSDMCRGAFAHQRCLEAALGVTLLFVWMKTWQAVFGQGLRACILGQPNPPWTVRRWMRQAIRQTALQWHGFVSIPLAIMLMLPLPAVYGFYQNLSVIRDDEMESLGAFARKAWRQALLWPMQNGIVIWLLSPWLLAAGMLFAFGTTRAVVSMVPGLYEMQDVVWFLFSIAVIFYFVLPFSFLGCIVAGNIAVVLLVLPELLRMFLGIETVFSLASWSAMFNSTFLMTVYAISYLCMDPFTKAAYALRCFYGESIRSGDDLLVELRSAGESSPPDVSAPPPPSSTPLPARRPTPGGLVAALALAAAFSLLPTAGPVLAQESPAATISADRLDQALEQTIARPEYSWRLPREHEVQRVHVPGFWDNFFDKAASWLKDSMRTMWQQARKLGRWLKKVFSSPDKSPAFPEMDWAFIGWLGIYLVSLVIASVVGVLLYRLWKGRRPAAEPVTAAGVAIMPESLEDTSIADKLPSDEWLNLARELLARGDLRLALRAMFLASLAFLAHHDRITIARHKSNREYIGELRRKGHDRPLALDAFARNVDWIERVWYGAHPPSRQLVETFTVNLDTISAQITQRDHHPDHTANLKSQISNPPAP